jgi:phosphatidylglycerophosphatase A
MMPGDLFVLLPSPELDRLPLLVATVLGTGLLEPLRAGLALAVSFPLILAANRAGPRWARALALAGLVMLGWWAAESWGSATGTSDDRRIVIDEVAGALAMALAAPRLRAIPLGGLALAFLALDRLKPWPFSAFENLSGGIGVMADDLAVGLAIGIAATALDRMMRLRG